MSRACGVDVGTAFFQTAEKQSDNTIKTQIVRNAFVEMAFTEDTEEMFKRNGWQYIKDGDKVYIPGEDAIKVAKFLPGKVEMRRPLQDGVLNKGEEKKMLVLDHIISSTIGEAPDKDSVVCICVSSTSADGSQDSAFHRMRLESMFKAKKWNVKIIEEGMAVILSERPTVTEIIDGVEKETPYSGLGVSFGGGRTNCVLAYKGVQITGMSVSRAGDWLDQRVSEATGVPLAQVINHKETKLDFDNLGDSEISLAYDVYYDEMLRYVFGIFGKEFQKVKSQFDYPLDVVVAGGTSNPKGFLNKLKQLLSDLELPFKIKDVKHARVPRNAVVEGCLAQAIVTHKKLLEEAKK